MEKSDVQSQRDNNEGRKSSSRVCVQGHPRHYAGEGEPDDRSWAIRNCGHGRGVPRPYFLQPAPEAVETDRKEER